MDSTESTNSIPDSTSWSLKPTPRKADSIPDSTSWSLEPTPRRTNLIPDWTSWSLEWTPRRADSIPDSTSWSLKPTPRKARTRFRTRPAGLSSQLHGGRRLNSGLDQLVSQANSTEDADLIPDSTSWSLKPTPRKADSIPDSTSWSLKPTPRKADSPPDWTSWSLESGRRTERPSGQRLLASGRIVLPSG